MAILPSKPKNIEPVHLSRFATAASVLDSSIYAVGGFDGKTYLSSAERYDPRDGRWHKVR